VAGPEPVFVLVRSPVTALRLREAGVEFPLLNVGGLGAGPTRKPLYRNISASPDERDAMRQLERMGTRVELRIVENDRPVAFASVDK
jgi:mannose/fructose/N-acetylgalactosamine-specific phosphotransferase system component IIB